MTTTERDEPGAEVAVRDEGAVATVVDAELVPKPTPAPVTLAGTIVRRPGDAARELATRHPVATARGRTVARIVVTTGQGYQSWARRAGQAATHGVLREQVRATRAAGNREQLTAAIEQLQKAKDARARRLKELPGNLLGLLKATAGGLALAVVLLTALGLGVQLAPGGWGWSDWWDALGWLATAAGSLLYLAAVVGLWAAVPLQAWAAWKEGRRAAEPPRWLLTEKERATVDVEITPAKVVLALRDLGLPKLRDAIREAADGAGHMLGTITIAGCGVEVDVLLPSGVSTDQVQARRRRLAENLDRHEHEVFITVAAARTVRLWIADSGALDEPVGPSPLVTDLQLRADTRSGRAPWGPDLRGDPVGVSLHQRHMTVTGLSNQGKTAAMRALALWVALDPRADLWVADLKGVGDWDMFSGIADRYIKGPTDGHVAQATEMLEAAVDEMTRRLEAGKDDCRRRLFVIVDEAQVAFMCPEKDDDGRQYGGTKATSRYFRAARQIHNQGRAVDVVLWQGTQDPTDQNFPKLVREGAHIRASLVVGTEPQARMALGDKAVDQGAAPHLLRADLDKGVIVMHGGAQLAPGQSSVTIRTHFVGDEDAEKVARRAIALRARRGRHLAAVEAVPARRDHLVAIERALRGEKRTLTSVVLARLIEDDPGEYERRDLTWLSGVLDEEGAPKQKGGDGRIYVVADRVRRALENPARGA